MKITAPIDRVSEVLPLIETGTDEFYCGVLDKNWLSKYTYLATTSSRNSPHSHLSSIEELKEIISIAHSHSVRIFLAVNDVIYTAEQYSFILNLMEKAMSCGIDGFIIGDVALLVRLREIDFKGNINISLRGTAFNSETVRFYKNLGCKRINLPQDLTVEEIKNIIEEAPTDVEFETFILNGKCANVCGFCSFHHGINTIIQKNDRIFDLVCFKRFDISLDEEKGDSQFNQLLCKNVRPKDRDFKSTHCGVCALWDFQDMGIASVKILGRGFPLSKKVKDVAFVRRHLDLVETGRLTKEEFIRTVRQDFFQTYKSNCEQYCYYYADYHTY